MVGTGAGEGLDPKRLFDGLEEQLDLPAVLVDGRDGGGRQLQVVGDEHHGLLFFFHPNFDAAHARLGPLLLNRGEQNDFIAHNVAVGGNRALRDHTVVRVVFEAGHKDHFLLGQLQPPLKIDVATIRTPAPFRAPT